MWAGTYQNRPRLPGGALHGANSTVDRWARAIGGTAAHEGGHTYGLSHNTDTRPGEDAFGRHLMPAGSDVNQEQRAGYRRHFSDDEFSTLAANVGLSIQTMHNWDLVNPNSQTAHRFRLTFLSPQSSPVMSWSYGGPLSPWSDPDAVRRRDAEVQRDDLQPLPAHLVGGQGLERRTGRPGAGRREFHVGATFSGVDFNQPDPIIITKSELLDDDGDPLPLKPRLPGYDVGNARQRRRSFELASSTRAPTTCGSTTSWCGSCRGCCRSTRWSAGGDSAIRSASRSAVGRGR